MVLMFWFIIGGDTWIYVHENLEAHKSLQQKGKFFNISEKKRLN